MSDTIAIILLAGIGSRLGFSHPKSMTDLKNGETILQRSTRILRENGLQICGVVGFKKELIMESEPSILFVHNPYFDRTNTSKSLLAAVNQFQDKNILWLNGDVVFDEHIIQSVLKANQSCVAVNNESVSDEEIKYTLDENGYINELSKVVKNGLGEAIGVNYVVAEDVSRFKKALEQVDDNDYFEKAMEVMIADNPNSFLPIDVSDFKCIEIDFSEDLDNARNLFKT